VPLETRNAGAYILVFDNIGALATGVAVANPTSQAASIPVIIRDDAGAQIGFAIINLAAQGHTSFMLNQQYPVTAGRRGSIEFDTPSNGRISVLGLRANGPALTTLPVLANMNAGGASITHATYNGEFSSAFYIVNTGANATQFTMSFFDDAGNPFQAPLWLPQTGTITTTSNLSGSLAAGAILVAETVVEGRLGGISGSALLTTTGNVTGFEIFHWIPNGQEASVPLETRAPNSFVLVYDNTDGVTTGVALANISSAAANLTIHLRDDSGALLLTTSIDLAARGHMSFMLPNNYSLSTGKRGTVEFVVPQDRKISAIGLRATTDGKLTTIPVLTK